MRARMYEPRLGRLTQADPILGNRPFKHYAYASNNPISRFDSWGLDDDPWLLLKALEMRKAWDRLVDEPWSTNPFIEGIRGGLRGVRNIGDSIGRGGMATTESIAHPVQTYENVVERTGESITAVREEGLGNVLKVSGQSIARMAAEDPEHFSAELAGTLTLAAAPTPMKGLSPFLTEVKLARLLTTPIKSLEILDTTVGDVAGNAWKYAKQSGSRVLDAAVAFDQEGGLVLAPGVTGRSGPVIRNAHLAGGTHESGIPFDAKGFPDFSSVAIKEVKIKLTGNRARDLSAANEAAGLSETPDKFTWHHHQDRTTMQLVPTDIHRMTGHTGGFSLKE